MLRRLFSLIFLLTLVGCDSTPVIPDLDSGITPSIDSGPGDAGPPEPMCEDSVRNGDESGIDCGGSCPPCVDGDPCRDPEDCESGVCGRGFCLVPSCMDGVRNGEETGVDCGGDCPLCGGGQPCTSNDECLSGRCRGGECAESSCEDGRQNADETDVDCGGGTCPACAGELRCLVREDCVSMICAAGTCTTPACNDGVQNQDETSVDCGGATCPGCRDGLACNIDADCESTRCLDGGCVSCADRVRNGDETGVDCGGTLCDPCSDGEACLVPGDCASARCESSLCVSCMDAVQNGDETDVDCGGSLCAACANGRTCLVDPDCASMDCSGGLCRGVADTCSDAVALSDGRNVVDWVAMSNDYFGAGLPSCVTFGSVDGPDLVMTFTASVDGVVEYEIEKPASEEMALVVSDAPCGMRTPELHCRREFTATTLSGEFPVTTGTTYTLYVVDVDTGAPTLIRPLAVTLREVDGRCRDGVASGMETDVDCGGPICPACDTGEGCAAGSDCASGICAGGTCNAPGCGDGMLNGMETDLDCGGACLGCADGQMCMVGGDCLSGVCAGGVCQAPSCTDGVRNGDETDVDCGGPTACPRCADFRRCTMASDCVAGVCTTGVCGTIACLDVDGFETGSWPYAPWVVQAGGGTIDTAVFHDGARALRDPDWHYRTDQTIGMPGDRLEAWAQATGSGGRFYLGFDAGAAGARSLVLAPNTDELLFQQNSAYGYSNLSSTPYTSWVAGRWYRIEVEFMAGNAVVGRLYDADGVTVLATVSHTFPDPVVGGVAVRGFSGVVIDSIRFCR